MCKYTWNYRRISAPCLIPRLSVCSCTLFPCLPVFPVCSLSLSPCLPASLAVCPISLPCSLALAWFLCILGNFSVGSSWQEGSYQAAGRHPWETHGRLLVIQILCASSMCSGRIPGRLLVFPLCLFLHYWYVLRFCACITCRSYKSAISVL